MTRIFVVVGHRVRTDARFNLNDLCGSTGRLDILLRAINSAFLLSNGLRRDVELYLVLKGEPDPPVTIHLLGNELRYLNPDERSTGALVRQALLTRRKDGREVRSTPGIYASERDYPEIIKELGREGIPVCLCMEGEALHEAAVPSNAFFVLGDQYDLTSEEEEELGDALKLSVGPLALHTDHCVILLHNELDRREGLGAGSLR